jgi:hypothetical protein
LSDKDKEKIKDKSKDKADGQHQRQTGSLIWFQSWIVWQWCKKEARDRNMGRTEHLFADLVSQYIKRNLAEEDAKKINFNSTEELYKIYKIQATKENLSIAALIEKVCTAEMERTSGLKISSPKTVEKKGNFWDLNAGVEPKK